MHELLELYKSIETNFTGCRWSDISVLLAPSIYGDIHDQNGCFVGDEERRNASSRTGRYKDPLFTANMCCILENCDPGNLTRERKSCKSHDTVMQLRR